MGEQRAFEGARKMIEESPLEPSPVIMGDGELAGAGRGDLRGDAPGHGLGDLCEEHRGSREACLSLGCLCPRHSPPPHQAPRD